MALLATLRIVFL